MTPSFKDRAPRIVKDPPGFKGHYFIIEGMEPKKLTGLFNAGLSPKEVKEQQDRDPDIEGVPAGGLRPHRARMEDSGAGRRGGGGHLHLPSLSTCSG